MFPIVALLVEVLNNQQWLDNQFRFSSLFNALTYGLALFVLWSFGSRRITWLMVAAFVGVQLVRFGAGVKEPLIVYGCILFFLTAAVLTTQVASALRRQFIWLMAANSGMMLIQVLGLASWAYVFSTHGMMSGEDARDLGFFPTFMVEASDLKGSFIQGRPSGFLHSNQTATMCVIFILGFLLVNESKTDSKGGAFSTLASAILSLSKVALAASVILPAAAASLKRIPVSRAVWWYVGPAIAMFGIYSLLFPGVVATYLDPRVFAVSLFTRLFDILPHFGILRDHPVFESAVEVSNQTVGPVVTHEIAQVYQRTSGFAQIASAPLLSLAVAGGLVFFGLRDEGRYSGWRNAVVGIISTCLVLVYIPALTSKLFWMFVGLTFPQSGRGLLRAVDAWKAPHVDG